MKKLFLLATVAGLVAFTSCKKTAEGVVEDTKDATEAVGDAAGDAVDATGDAVEAVGDAAGDAVDATGEAIGSAGDSLESLLTGVPTFENAELSKWANDLKDAAKSASEAASKGDATALTTATESLTSLAEGLNSFKDDPEFSKASEYYNKIKSALE